MKRMTLLAALLFLTTLTSTGQEKHPSWVARTVRNYFHGLTARKKTFDSTFVYQTPLKWTVALESEMLRPDADLIFDFTTPETNVDGSLAIGLLARPCHKLGIAAGYGSLRLGYGVQLGKKEGDRNKYFGFGINSTSYGVQIRYYKVHPHPTGAITLNAGIPTSLTSNLPGELRTLSLDGFYAFNQRRFLFNAAYSGRHLQRRSAGSWMVTSRYLQGDFSLNPDDPIGDRLAGASRFATRQLSVGGGYSFNWTILHRDPTDHACQGLRNLTVNATALPMVSFLNLVRIGEGKKDDSDVRYKNMPTFTPAVRSALCYSRERWSFCAEIYYCRYGFRGAEKDISRRDTGQSVHITTRGAFNDLTVKGKVNLHF